MIPHKSNLKIVICDYFCSVSDPKYVVTSGFKKNIYSRFGSRKLSQNVKEKHKTLIHFKASEVFEKKKSTKQGFFGIMTN